MLGTIPEPLAWLPFGVIATALFIGIIRASRTQRAKRLPLLISESLSFFGFGLAFSLSIEASMWLFDQTGEIRKLHGLGIWFGFLGLLFALFSAIGWIYQQRYDILYYIRRLLHIKD